MEILIHNSINNYNLMELLIEKMNLDNILESKNKGIISNILFHYIKNSNDEKIIYILSKNLELMKRDYLRLIIYYYKTDFNKSLHIFNTFINKLTLSTNDLNLLIENEIYEVIKLLDKFYIYCSIDNYIECNPIQENLKLIDFPIDDKNKLLEKINIYIPNNYNTIIDGGSVIHNRNGKITNKSLQDLLYIYSKSDNPIIIIHERHKKTIPNLELTFEKFNIKYHFTKYGEYDDLYILAYFLNSNNAFIITNDKFKDHIYNYKIDTKIKFILLQFILNFNCNNKYIQPKPLYSKCIQVINNCIYIFHTDNKFIKIMPSLNVF